MLEDLCTGLSIDSQKYEDFQYGRKLTVFSRQHPVVAPHAIALVTMGEDLTPYQTLRKQLYRMSANFKAGQLWDLGGLKGGAYGVAELVDQLEKKGILCILIGEDELLPYASFNALRYREQAINACIVNSHLEYHFGQGEKISLADHLLSESDRLLHKLSWMGYQSYFVNPAILQTFQQRNFDYQRVGDLRSQLEEIEPALRDADLLGFHLSAIHHRDSPASDRPNPNGFSALEACQITHYGGLSDRLKAFSICGYRPGADEKDLSALLIAQMIWYLLKGRQRTWNEYPPELEKLRRYELQTQLGGQPISFFKSQRSERWWFYINDQQKEVDISALHPCSYKDYLLMCEGDVPERVLNALQRN